MVVSLLMVWLNPAPDPPAYPRCSACRHVADPHGPAPDRMRLHLSLTRAHGAEDVDVPVMAPITAGQMRALLAGVGDDVPLRALYGPPLRNGMQEWEIVAARRILQGRPPEGPRVHFALYLRKGGRTGR